MHAGGPPANRVLSGCRWRACGNRLALREHSRMVVEGGCRKEQGRTVRRTGGEVEGVKAVGVSGSEQRAQGMSARSQARGVEEGETAGRRHGSAQRYISQATSLVRRRVSQLTKLAGNVVELDVTSLDVDGAGWSRITVSKVALGVRLSALAVSERRRVSPSAFT
jgi:hypothetical protein